MRAPDPARIAERESGVVLILVTLILLVVTSLALSLGRDAKVEVALALERADDLRLRALIDSAVERAMAEVRNDTTPGDDLFAIWRDDQANFEAMELGEGKIWFLLPSPDPGDGRVLRYGLRDEASKLDVNTATEEQLLAIPGITQEAVDGILDWRDEDDDASPQGGESSYYASLDPPYTAKNGPIESLDELLRVKGIDEQMLYGEDRNRNGLLDPGEDDGDRSFPPDDADGTLDRGLVDYLTVFARDLNRTKDGRARLILASAQPQEIEQALTAAGASQQFAQAVTQALGGGGPGQGGAQGGGPGQGGGQGGGTPQSMGELVIRLGQFSSDATQVAILLDEVSAIEGDLVPGRINVNTCSRELLIGLGLQDDQADAILEQRLQPDADHGSVAWLLNVLDPQVFATVVDRLTARSDQFTVEAVALLNDRPRFRRVEVLIDRNFVPVRVLLWRDLTSLGFPLPGERGDGHP
ncbi:MAG: general secretion pathway protein GspK [Planctomycetota bacterium]